MYSSEAAEAKPAGSILGELCAPGIGTAAGNRHFGAMAQFDRFHGMKVAVQPNRRMASKCEVAGAWRLLWSHTEGEKERELSKRSEDSVAEPAQSYYLSHTEGRSPVLKSPLRSDQGVK